MDLEETPVSADLRDEFDATIGSGIGGGGKRSRIDEIIGDIISSTSQFHPMPPRRKYKARKSSGKRYRRFRGRTLTPAATMVAKQADIAIKKARMEADFNALKPTLSDKTSALVGGALTAPFEHQMLTRAGRVRGQGKYTFGSFLRDAERTGRRFLRAGGGMDTILGAAQRAKGVIQGMGRYSGMGRYEGMGEYHDNQLIDGGRGSMDLVGNSDETDTVILHDEEFVQNVYAPAIAAGESSGFAAISIAFNPGLQNLTRKLSQYSKHYQEYSLKQLLFTLEPMVEESNVNNGISGSFSMAWQYDPNDEEPDNEDDMNALYGVTIGHKLSDGLRLGVECDRTKNLKDTYRIRSHPVPYGRDVDEYDHGKLVISSNNIPSVFSNLAVAKLHIYYTIELRKFKPDHTVLRDLFSISKNATNAAFGATPQTSFTEKSVIFAQQNNLGCKVEPGPNGGEWKITFPPTFSGSLSVDLVVEGSGLAAGTGVKTKTGNVTFIQDFLSATPDVGDAPTDSLFVGTALQQIFRVRCRIRSATGSVENTILLDFNPSAGSITSWTLDIQEYSPQFFQSRSNPVPIMLNYSSQRVEDIN